MRLLPKDPSLGWTRYVWLVYSLPMLAQPILSGRPRDWLLVVGAFAVFLPLYFRGFWLKGRKLLPVMAAILLLGCLYAPINSSATVFFIYAASFLGHVGRPAVGARYLAGILLVLGLEAWLVGIPNQAWIWGMVFSLIIGGINMHFAEVSRNQAKLRLAHEEVERLATTAERERIARDLHDLLGHTLSLITIKSGLAARLARKAPERAEDEMRQVETIARDALSEVRQAVRGFRSLSLGAETAKAKVALAAAGVELSYEPGPFDLDADAESAAALALREAVTNVVRHARAHGCTIRFSQSGGEFRLDVDDDGTGGVYAEGNGLAGMRERIEALGGEVVVDGSRGTRICVRLPVHRAAVLPQAAAR
jgi:two-component system sensor histidine kinase DesK